MKNYRPADCCRNCYNMDSTEPPEEEYFCSIFHDPIEFDYVCDDFEDSSVPFLSNQIMGKFDEVIESLEAK
jgi:hypothetical protein